MSASTELVLPNGQTLAVRDRRAVAEVRDPRAATKPVTWTNRDLPIVNDWDADQAFRLGYAANVIAYRCVQLRAQATAKIPLVAGRRLGDAGSIVENAAILKLLGPLGQPAPKLSARKLLRWTIAQEIVTGRRAWEIETHDAKPDGRPIAFWPLAAGKLDAIPSTSGNEWFRLFTYGQVGHPDRVKLDPELVFYGWDPAGHDFRQAESAFAVGRYDLSLVTLCDRYGMAFLRNSAVPASIVTTDAFANDAQRKAFRRQWASVAQGVDNAGRTMFNEAGEGDGPVADSISVQVLGMSAKDSRLVEQRKEAMQELAIGLGVPWSKLDASGRTYDNAEAEDRTFYEETVLEDLTALQDDINLQLAPRLGNEVVWFDLRTVRALRRRRFAVGSPTDLLASGAVTVNEVREDIELEPIDGGDDVVVLATIEPSPPLQLDVIDEEDDERTPPVLPVVTPEPIIENRAADPEAIEARRAAAWSATDRAAAALEKRWERAFRRLFRRQGEATLARLTGKRGRQALERRDAAVPIDTETIFSLEFWRAETRNVADDLIEQVVVAGLERLTGIIGIAFDLEAPWVQDFVTTRANQLAGQVTTTTYEQITAVLAEGVASGASIDDLAEGVQAVFAQADTNRARTIARTEVISSYSGATVAAAEELPSDVVAGFQWLATRDSRTRDSHAAVDGQVVARGTPFSVGGYAAAYPGDPSLPAAQTVNCRCAVLTLTPEEMAEEMGLRVHERVEVRHAKALLDVLSTDTDLMAWRRALPVVAA